MFGVNTKYLKMLILHQEELKISDSSLPVAKRRPIKTERISIKESKYSLTRRTIKCNLHLKSLINRAIQRGLGSSAYGG